MKTQRKILAAGIVLLVLAAIMFALYTETRPEPWKGEKTITVEVVHSDGTSKAFIYETDAEYLGEVLLSYDLVMGEEGPYGLYITAVDGEEAIYEVDQSYWSLYEGEEYATLGADVLAIEDGDVFSLVYTEG